MKKEVKKFDRKELFDNYNKRDNPFIFVTTKLDITNIYNYCKIHKNYYASISYVLCMAINDIEEFKYQLEDGKIYKYDYINPAFVHKLDNNKIAFSNFVFEKDYDKYIKLFKEVENEVLKSNKSVKRTQDMEVWFSCTPWFKFTSLIPPFDKTIMTPQMIWDKFEFANDKCYINLMICAHHGLVDGYHIVLLIERINYYIDDFNKIKTI